MLLRSSLTLLLFCAIVNAQVSDSRYAHLARGVNLTRWFQYGSRQPVTTADRDLLLKAGFTSVRIAVAPQYLLLKWRSAARIAATLTRLDAGIDLFLDAGMAVTLDFQADAEYLDYYLATPGAPQELVDTWRMLASRYADRTPELLFFEIMNEPDTRFTQAAWDVEQKAVLAAIREAAPLHTVLLAPVGWSGLDPLVQMTPYRDPNVIYVLHYYLPTTFTHQGATWTSSADLASLRNVPWPAFLSDGLGSLLVRQYRDDDRDAESIDWDMSLAQAWAKRWNVRVVVNEFGSYKPFSPPDSRARWLHDVRLALDRHHLAWAMWDYGAGFDLTLLHDGVRSMDEDVLAALGLSEWTRPDPVRDGGRPVFSSFRPVQLGASPDAAGYSAGILASDINGDGFPDVIVTQSSWPELSGNPVQIFLNSGNGMMQPAAFDGPAPVQRFVPAIVPGKFDRSGRSGFFFPDRGFSNGEGGQSGLALPSGTGSLRDATGNLPQRIVRTTGAAAGDVDGDGIDDLVAFDPAPELLRNDGNGHFQIDSKAFPLQEHPYACGLFVGRDLVVFGPEGGRVLVNEGKGHFGNGAILPVPDDSGGPVIGTCAVRTDSNDVIVAFENDVIQIWRKTANGSFRDETAARIGPLPASITGLRGISLAQGNLIAGRKGEGPLVFAVNRDGVFVDTGGRAGSNLSVVAPGDFNGDGLLDLVFGNAPLMVRFGQTPR